MAETTIASAMICEKPKRFGKYTIVSAYDGAWEPVKRLPNDIAQYVSDDLGNPDVEYGGFLQINNLKVLQIIQNHKFFTCFRGVLVSDLERVQTVPAHEIYQRLEGDLITMGWDICTGNGWRSASCDGYFPINALNGIVEVGSCDLVNEWGLLKEFEKCLEFCLINNKEIPEDAPWYPVKVYLDKGSYNRLHD